MSKKIKNQTNGKTVEIKKPLPRSLDELWGAKGTTKYGTLELEVYEKQLKEMTKADMQSHAMKLGHAPIDDFPRLKKHLINEFLRYKATYSPRPEPKSNIKAISPEVKKILAEGR